MSGSKNDEASPISSIVTLSAEQGINSPCEVRKIRYSGCNWIIFFLQFFHLLDELTGFLKPPIHTRVSHISNRVQLMQLGHDPFANCHRRHFAIELIPDFLFDFVRDLLDFLRTHWTFAAGNFEALQQFLPGEGFAPIISLYHRNRFVLDLFVSGKAMSTAQAFASPSDGCPFPRGPGIDHFVFLTTTLAATHILFVVVKLEYATICGGVKGFCYGSASISSPHLKSFSLSQ